MTIAELRHEWEADIKRRNGILASLFRQVGPGGIAYQLEYARICLTQEHLAALDDLT